MNHKQLIEQLAEELVPVARLPKLRVLYVKFVVICAILGLIVTGSHGLRLDQAIVMVQLSFWLECGLLFAAALIAVVLAILSSIPGRMISMKSGLRYFSFCGIAWIMALSLHSWQSLQDPVVNIWQGFACGILIALLAIIPTVWLSWQIKKLAPVRPRLIGSLSVMAAMGLAALNQQFLCHLNGAVHLLLWHALPLVMAGAIGLLLGRRLYSW